MSSLFVRILIIGGLLGLAISDQTQAEIPRNISYQGKVTDAGGSPVADGAYMMEFKIFDAETGQTRSDEEVLR